MRKPFWIIPLLLAAFGPPALADSLTITSTPDPTSLPSGTGTLTDSATLSGGNSPQGTITFALFFEGNPIQLFAETQPISGDGTYTTDFGFTLPTVGPVDGVYQWDVTYNGDSNNPAVSDNNDPNEQVVVGPVVAAPEPDTLILVVAGLVGLVGIHQRRKLPGYLHYLH